MSKKIVVVDRGFVMVGQLEKDGEFYLILNGSIVRRWGTTKGLGELAMNGPLSETVLDPIPLTKVHEDKVIFTMNCDESKWKQ